MTLQEYLTLSGQSQAVWAREKGFGVSIVSRWVNGLRVPSRQNISKITEQTKGAVSWTDWTNTTH